MTTGDLPPIPPARLPAEPFRICIVCTGNICRSPMAEVVLREMTVGEPADVAGARRERSSPRLEISSAGIGPWHVGEAMDPRAQAALARAGHSDHGHTARQISADELPGLDLVLALDRRHSAALGEMDREGVLAGRLFLLGRFDPERHASDRSLEIADPFYGDDADFERCLREVEAACRGLAQALGAVPDDGA